MTSSIIYILLFFFFLSNACQLAPFFGTLRADSLRQGLYPELQYVSVKGSDDEFEVEMIDESLAVYSRYSGFHYNNLIDQILFTKSVDVIKISFHGHSPRSPSLQ